MSDAVAAIRQAFAAAQQGKFAEARAICGGLLARDPGYLPALRLGGVVAAELGQLDDAIELLGRAAAKEPADASTRAQLGTVLRVRADRALETGRHADAVGDYDRALACDPGNADTHYNRATALSAQNREDEAVQGYERALALRPAFPRALLNRGVALSRLARHAEAVASLDRAIALDPSYADAWINRGNALRALDRDAEALASYTRAMQIDPGAPFLRGTWLHARMSVCDWSGIEDACAELEARVLRGERASPPFPVLGLSSSAEVLHAAATTWVAARCPERRDVPPIAPRAPHAKLRIGYFAATLHEHATAYLMAELFERHDRDAFEIVAFSFGPDTGDAMRARLGAAFDRFEDIARLSDVEAAMRARELGIDIAVDLMGYTRDGRPGIFACRAAPIQVAYLGYPGTMGAPYIDYAIADRVVVPDDQRTRYTERVVRMPACYQVNDAQRPRPASIADRSSAGLPDDAFVYCCFNNNWKVTPRIFDAWMRILSQVDGSVLWLMQDNPWAADNLRKEAQARGMDPSRLVFAPRVRLAEHLARHHWADLFLDTLPYNAHTTASDALWMGLPVLTTIGDLFPGRVAASLLGAAGMPELVAPDLPEYERCAIALAQEPARLAMLRRNLADRLPRSPLFDAGAFARSLEDAYRAMEDRRHAGLAPDHFDVG
ncbi:MAG: tetratricopeptide repeat protein [Burkholderiales bacterium]